MTEPREVAQKRPTRFRLLGDVRKKIWRSVGY